MITSSVITLLMAFQPYLYKPELGPLLLPCSMATIDAQVSAGHEATRIAQQKDSRTAVLLGHAQPAKHIILCPRLATLGKDLEQRLGHGCDDIAGRNGVDTDAVGAPFHRQVLGELDDSCFGGIVEAESNIVLVMFMLKYEIDLGVRVTYGAVMPLLAIAALILAI